MRLPKIRSIFSTLARISQKRRASLGTVHLQADSIIVIATGLKVSEWVIKSGKKCRVH